LKSRKTRKGSQKSKKLLISDINPILPLEDSKESNYLISHMLTTYSTGLKINKRKKDVSVPLISLKSMKHVFSLQRMNL